jgi:exosortase/archaeosortase
MFERTKARALPVINSTAENVPMVTACCNVCRTCVTSNAITLLTGAAVAVGAGLTRFARRFAHP